MNQIETLVIMVLHEYSFFFFMHAIMKLIFKWVLHVINM